MWRPERDVSKARNLSDNAREIAICIAWCHETFKILVVSLSTLVCPFILSLDILEDHEKYMIQFTD